ncbi:MAG: sigma-70 family RNA polymerase sigma factor [Tissierellaceae bacterium]
MSASVVNNQMEKLYIKYHKELYLYAFSLCKNHHLAQDLTSDTFFKAYLSVDNVNHIKYWLFRVCKNLYLDYIKLNREYGSHDIIENTLSNYETTLDKIIESESSKNLYNLIINLNESYKEILILYYFCDFSLEEISKSRNTTEGAAKTMLYRARKKLKKEMEGSK